MVWSNELILLAPRVLSSRKPLEHPSFIALYTAINKEYSKGFIYLVFRHIDANQVKDLEGSLINTKYYYSMRLLYVNNKYFIVFTFYIDDINIEEYKEHGNIGFTIDDYAIIFTFWGDLIKDMPRFYNEDIFECKNKLNEEDLL